MMSGSREHQFQIGDIRGPALELEVGVKALLSSNPPMFSSSRLSLMPGPFLNTECETLVLRQIATSQSTAWILSSTPAEISASMVEIDGSLWCIQSSSMLPFGTSSFVSASHVSKDGTTLCLLDGASKLRIQSARISRGN